MVVPVSHHGISYAGGNDNPARHVSSRLSPSIYPSLSPPHPKPPTPKDLRVANSPLAQLLNQIQWSGIRMPLALGGQPGRHLNRALDPLSFSSHSPHGMDQNCLERVHPGLKHTGLDAEQQEALGTANAGLENWFGEFPEGGEAHGCQLHLQLTFLSVLNSKWSGSFVASACFKYFTALWPKPLLPLNHSF